MALRLPHPPNLPSLAKALAIAAAHQSGFTNPIKRFHGPPEGMQIGMMLGGGPILPARVMGGARGYKAAGVFHTNKEPLELRASHRLKEPLQSDKLKRAISANKSRTQRKGIPTGISAEAKAKQVGRYKKRG